MKKYDRLCGLIWFILGIGFSIGGIKLNLGAPNNPAPGFFPFLSGIVLGLLGLILVFSTISKELGEGKDGEVTGKKILGNGNWKTFLIPSLTLLTLFGYALLFEYLGFIFTTFLAMFFLSKLSKPKEWLAPLVFSVSVCIISYVIFTVFLQCQLPRGIFRF